MKRVTIKDMMVREDKLRADNKYLTDDINYMNKILREKDEKLNLMQLELDKSTNRIDALLASLVLFQASREKLQKQIYNNGSRLRVMSSTALADDLVLAIPKETAYEFNGKEWNKENINTKTKKDA